MKLRVTCFPKCEWKEDVGRELCIFEHKKRGDLSAFSLDEIELFPVEINCAGCRRQLPSKDKLVK